ncbi:MAG TPA: glycosyltransferase [Anaerolineales bacterium]|nr:glycosyltransferase [Anaerolineales bacterium]
MGKPRLSIVIPAFESHATVADSLKAIEKQDLQGFEVILVDSSPTDRGAEIVARQFPGVRLVRPAGRLLPHEARNLGVSHSSADLIVFTDPDIYPSPSWLDRLANAHAQEGGLIVGSVLCHGRKWLDVGTHLAKFDLWLPGGSRRPIEISPTLNCLCSRDLFEKVGGFRGEFVIGDTIFSWNVARAGYPVTFEPGAVVWHHHMASWGSLLRERYDRGVEFGRMRSRFGGWSWPRLALHSLVTLLPLRWAGLTIRTFRHSAAAGLLNDFLLTLPITSSAHAAWLAGESRGFLGELWRRARRRPAASGR